MTSGSRLAEFSTQPFVPRVPCPPATDDAGLDRAVARVGEGARAFARCGIRERIGLLASLRRGFRRVADAVVAAACRAKGIEPGTPLEGEEWAGGPLPTLRLLRLLQQSLEAIAATGTTPVGSVAPAADGRLSVRLFPLAPVDRLVLRGASVDARFLPGVDAAAAAAGRAAFYRGRGHDGRVVAILGGGNIAAIPATDALSKLFVEGKACVLKMNPVNAYVGPFLEEAFAAAIGPGYLAIVYGGAEAGERLCRSPGVDEIHVTGSDKTHDRIVWGPPGAEREARRAAGTPLLAKPVTSELGNVSPVILVPGPWSDAELRAQAADAAGYATMNASFLCNAAKVLVTPRGWAGRERFLEHFTAALAQVPARLAYYPGAAERWRVLTAGRERVQLFGEGGGGRLPWALVTGLDPLDRAETLFAEECFCPVVAETSVGSDDPLEFLAAAVAFANEALWGTLSAGVAVCSRSAADPRVSAALDASIARLRYGTVAVNAFPGLSYALAAPPWGGHPGATDADIQSGRGFVHNSSMLEGVEQVVLRHPARAFPPPAYVPGRRAYRAMARRLAEYEAEPSWRKIPPLAAAALGG